MRGQKNNIKQHLKGKGRDVTTWRSHYKQGSLTNRERILSTLLVYMYREQKNTQWNKGLKL